MCSVKDCRRITSLRYMLQVDLSTRFQDLGVLKLLQSSLILTILVTYGNLNIIMFLILLWLSNFRSPSVILSCITVMFVLVTVLVICQQTDWRVCGLSRDLVG